MNNPAEYVFLLAVSVVLTFAVGRILVVAGEPFLEEVFRDRAVTRSVNNLLSVLFHLITLGVLALVSVIDLGDGDAVQRVVVRLGVVLLILGVAYGVCMLVLIRVRERRRATQISDEVTLRLAQRDRPATAPPATIGHAVPRQ